MKLQMRLKTKGQSMVIIGILIGTGVLIGLVALAFDGGGAMLQRRNMQNGADSASLGAAKALAASVVINDGVPIYSITNQTVADTIAQFFANNRGGTTGPASYTGQFEYGRFVPASPGVPAHYEYELIATNSNGSWNYPNASYPPGDLVPTWTDAVRVTAAIQNPTTFGQVIGINSIPVSAKAAAALQGSSGYEPQGPTWPMTRQYDPNYNSQEGLCKPVLFWSNQNQGAGGNFKSLVQLGAKQGSTYQNTSRHAQLLTQPDPIWSKADLSTSPNNQQACGYGLWSPKGNCSNPAGTLYGDSCCAGSGNTAKVDVVNWIRYGFFGVISTQSRAWRDLNDPVGQPPTNDWRSDDAKARDVAGDWLETYSGGNFGNVVQSSIAAYIAQYGTFGDDPPSVQLAYGTHIDKVMYLWQDAETFDYPAGCQPQDPCYYKRWLPTTDANKYMRVRMMKAVVFRFYQNLATSGGGTIEPPADICPNGGGVNSTGSEIYGMFVGEEIVQPPPDPGGHGLYNYVGPIDP